MDLVATLFALFCLAYSSDAIHHAVTETTLRFVRDNVPTTTQAWSSGIVQVYIGDTWGNICYDEADFGDNEADVICRQLGYDGHLEYSAAANAPQFGRDTNASIVLNRVTCNSGRYLALSQCDYVASSSPSSTSCNDDTDVAITCRTTRIWDRYPAKGDIRLTAGDYSNEGLLEVYCNGEWGTVCDTSFGAEAALLSCEQLGYNNYAGYNHLSLTGNSSQKVWLDQLDDDCSSDDSIEDDSDPPCLLSCKNCPDNAVTACSHEFDATLECRHDPGKDSLTTEFAEGTCDGIDDSDELAGLIVLIVAVVCVLCCCISILAISIPICICCCIGIGIGTGAGIGAGAKDAIGSGTTKKTSNAYARQHEKPSYVNQGLIKTTNPAFSAGQDNDDPEDDDPLYENPDN